MAYTRNPTWVDNVTTIDAARMENIEQGLAGAAGTTQTDIYLPVGAAGSQSTYTWTRPTGAKAVRVLCVGGGGGGGSGRRGATATLRGGGGGGSSGGLSDLFYEISQIPAALTIRVGKQGSAGAAVATDSTDGAAGGNGGESNVTPSTLLVAFPYIINYGRSGTGGGGGTSTAGGVGGTANTANGGSGNGANGSVGSGAASTSPTIALLTAGSGGGGISNANLSDQGGRVFAPQLRHSFASGNAAVGSNGSVSLDTSVIVSPYGGGAYGGAGGGAGVAAGGVGGTGGDAQWGCGGGGGGASLNGFASGAGGLGGDGIVVIVTYF